MALRRFSNHPNGIVKLNDLTANLCQLCGNGLQVLGNYIFNHNIPSGSRCRAHKGTGLNLIRDNGIFRTVKPFHATNTDGIRSCALNIGSHAVKEVRHIYDMRLLGCIFKDGLSLCHGRRHHDIDGGSHRNHIQINVACHQINGVSNHCPALDLHIRSQRPKSLYMLVNGTASDIAASRKRNLGALIFTQQSAYKVIRGADPTNVFIIHRYLSYISRIDLHCMTVDAAYAGTDLLNRLQHYVDIPHIRQIIDEHIFIRHNGRCQDTQCGILRTAYGHIAHQRVAAFYNIMFHFTPLMLI